MAEPAFQDVELPNGDVVANVPVGTSKAKLLDLLSKRGEITADQAAQWATSKRSGDDTTPITDSLMDRLPQSVATGGPPQTDPATMQGAGEMIAGNMDIPGGIAGAVAGAKAGAPMGPWGVLIGTVGGGAAGTFGGEILSDYFVGENPDIGEATKNAAISAGVDVATLGAASKFKTAMRLLGFDGKEISRLWKTYTTKKPAGSPQALTAGTPESLMQTQGLLEDGGGTLRAYQTGKASMGQRVSEGIAEVGALSGPMYQNLDRTNAATIAANLQKLAEESMVNPGGLDMGTMMYGIIDTGKDAASAAYDKGLTAVSKLAGKRTVDPRWFVKQIENFKDSGKRSWGNEYSTEALRLANAWQEQFASMGAMSVDDMLAFQRKLNGQINTMGKFGSSPAEQAASRDLAILSDKIRTTTEALLKNTNKKAHAQYVKLNQAFSEAMDGLVPKMNVTAVSKAGAGDYESIARVLEGKHPDQIVGFLKSIDTAFNSARLAGIDMAETAGVRTAAEAKEIVKAGWIKNIFGEITQDSFDPTKYATLAARMEIPANQRGAKAILGKDWPQFKALVNAIAESTHKPKGFIGSLVLRSKEAQAVGNVITGGVGHMVGGLAGLGAVLLGPVMLSKVITRPGAVRAILEGNARSEAALLAGKVGLASEITEQTISRVFGMLTEEEQAEVRQGVRSGNN